ncbi:MAG TPA: ribosomal protein S18-alanine N-acetyltransferase [Fimbriimonadaceae bacterium]|nr:ribosomal protein S18-alanine N-acetyltransferase [Fimbriimonadaceae bacterium]
MALKNSRFEALRVEHIPKILEIENRTNGAPWSERAFQNELTHRDRIFLVAIAGGEIVGYGGVWLVIDEAHVTTLAVDEPFRRQGIGEKLMIELLEKSKEAGMTCSTLEVRAGNEPAIRLYEKLGYSRAALRKGYYPDNKEDACVMWLYDLDGWSAPR